jgi:hypothetical protein
MLLKFLSNYRKKFFTLLIASTLSGICSYGQNLIGYRYMEIKKYMKDNHKELSFNNVSNSKFKYLKYTDSSDSQTLLFFLNSDSVCRSVRMICNVTRKDEKAREFNSIYKKTDDNRWIESRDGKEYLIKIIGEKWYYIITIEPDK